MPLTASGAKVKRAMEAEYGAEKGERVFYATANKRPALGRKWHGRRSAHGTRKSTR